MSKQSPICSLVPACNLQLARKLHCAWYAGLCWRVSPATFNLRLGHPRCCAVFLSSAGEMLESHVESQCWPNLKHACNERACRVNRVYERQLYLSAVCIWAIWMYGCKGARCQGALLQMSDSYTVHGACSAACICLVPADRLAEAICH